MKTLRAWLPWLLSVALFAAGGFAAPSISGGNGYIGCTYDGTTTTCTPAWVLSTGNLTVSSGSIFRGVVTPSGLSGTGTVTLASRTTTNGALWFASSPSTTNYAIGGGAAGTDTTINSGASGSIFFAIANVTKASMDSNGYFASTTPHTLSTVYVNDTIFTLTYGGGVLPAHAFTAQAIRYRVRTAGSGGSTNATFRISDGSNNCDFSFACNQSTGAKRQAATAGTCAFAASATLTYSFTSPGDCTTTTDIQTIDIEGIWQ